MNNAFVKGFTKAASTCGLNMYQIYACLNKLAQAGQIPPMGAPNPQQQMAQLPPQMGGQGGAPGGGLPMPPKNILPVPPPVAPRLI